AQANAEAYVKTFTPDANKFLTGYDASTGLFSAIAVPATAPKAPTGSLQFNATGAFGGSALVYVNPGQDAVNAYQITGSVTSGTFLANEVVIGGDSNATAYLVNLPTGSMPMIVGPPYTGFPDLDPGEGSWTGQTSGAVYTISPAVVPQPLGSGFTASVGNVGYTLLTTGGAFNFYDSATFSVALGYLNTATGSTLAIALGASNNASGAGSAAIGYNNNTGVNASGSSAIGVSCSAQGQNSTAIGYSTTTNGSGSTAIGLGNTAIGTGSSAVGANNTAIGLNSLAFGSGCEVLSDNSVVIGFGVINSLDDSTLIGQDVIQLHLSGNRILNYNVVGGDQTGGAGVNYFSIADDHSIYPLLFVAGFSFQVSGSTANDGAYTTVSSSDVSGNCQIVVSQAIPSATFDGQVQWTSVPAITALVPLVSTANLSVLSTLADGTSSVGTSGQLLSSTGTATAWINPPVVSYPVTSVFGRTGDVVATSGDYDVSQVSGATPLNSPTFTGTVAGITYTMVGADAAGAAATAQANAEAYVKTFTPDANKFLTGYDASTGLFSAITVPATAPGAPAGSLQFNATGAFGGSALVYVNPGQDTVNAYQITGSVTSGTFLANEVVEGGDSNATAYLVNLPTGSMPMIVGPPYTGFPDLDPTEGSWTGQTSGAVYTISPAVVPQPLGSGFTASVGNVGYTLLTTGGVFNFYDSATFSVALGYQNTATGSTLATALGASNNASGAGTAAIGYNNNTGVNASSSAAIGVSCSTQGQNSIAIGYSN